MQQLKQRMFHWPVDRMLSLSKAVAGEFLHGSKGRKIAFVLSNASTSERTQPTSRKLPNVEIRLQKVTKVAIQTFRL